VKLYLLSQREMTLCDAHCTEYHRSNNFIVGLTNTNPRDNLPLTLWNYVLCGQYPGAVPEGATVSLFCARNLPPSRYVVVQFPIADQMNFCELEVFAFGLTLSNIFYCLVDGCMLGSVV